MTPETDVKNYLRKELARFAKLLDVPIAVISNAASVSTEIGRPDCDIIINNAIYIHAEIKAPDKTASPAQSVFSDEDKYGIQHIVISGRNGVDSFIRQGLCDLIRNEQPLVIARMEHAAKQIIENVDTYIQDSEQRKRSAAKRPKRQSSRIGRNVRKKG